MAAGDRIRMERRNRGLTMEREELTHLEHEVITAFRSCPREMQDGICRMLGVKMNRGYGVRRVK